LLIFLKSSIIIPFTIQNIKHCR